MTDPRTVRRLLTLPLMALAVLLVLFEETFWRWMSAAGALLARLPLFAALERLVERLPPVLVFALFLIPAALSLPVILGAEHLMRGGHYVSGLALVVLAKSLGTAFQARLFVIARPKLMTVRLFAWGYGHVTRWLAAAHAFVQALPAWRAVKAWMAGAKAALRAWAAAGKRGLVALRFAAAKRRARRGMGA